MWKYIAVAVAAVVAACSGADMQPQACESLEAPGALVAVPGIDLRVRDPYGQGEAIGTTVTQVGGPAGPMQTYAADTLNIYTAYDVTGKFTLTLTRPYYQDQTIPNITVTPNGCLVNTTEVPVTLQLAPGAPPLRALDVAGASYLGDPGAQAHLIAHFDADPNVSRAVTWQVNDTTLATIDANGVATARCPNPGGTLKVTAKAVADPTVSGSASMSVAPFTASYCP
jgi:hypothetical protein